jgi:hypothetical protein
LLRIDSFYFENTKEAGHWRLMPIILATWEAEIRRLLVEGHSRQIVCETPISK